MALQIPLRKFMWQYFLGWRQVCVLLKAAIFEEDEVVKGCDCCKCELDLLVASSLGVDDLHIVTQYQLFSTNAWKVR